MYCKLTAASLFVVCCLFIPSKTARALTSDTSDASNTDQQVERLAFYPEAQLTVGIVNKKQVSNLNIGVGSLLHTTEQTTLAIIVSGEIYRVIDSTWIPSVTARIAFDYHLLPLTSNTGVHWLTTASYGEADLPVATLLQAVSGFTLSLPIGSDAYYKRTGLEIVATLGGGYDFGQRYGREFVSVGIALYNWLAISFDVSSLWKPMSPIINPGRL